MYLKIITVNLESCNISNIKSSDGGIIKSIHINNIYMFKVKINGIKSLYQGGLIYMNSLNMIKIEECEGNYIESLENSGGLFFGLFNNFLEIKKVKFIKIQCLEFGAFGEFSRNNFLNLIDCEFLLFDAKKKGGFLFLRRKNTLIVNSCIFTKIISSFGEGGLLNIFENNIIKNE